MVNFYEGATDVRYWQLRSKSLIKTVLSLIKQLYKCIAPEMLYWTVRILDADLEALAPLLKYSSKILRGHSVKITGLLHYSNENKIP